MATKTQHKKSASRVSVECPKCKEVFLPSTKSKQSRAGASARRKGQNFERRIAKELATWWNSAYPEPKFEFKRTPMSGGSALAEGWGLAGDIATTDPNFPFHCELKNQPSGFTGLHNFFSKKSKLWTWYKQAKDECSKDKIPLLIFNRYDQPTFCAIELSQDTYITSQLQKSYIDYFEFTYDSEDGSGLSVIAVWKFEDMIKSNIGDWK